MQTLHVAIVSMYLDNPRHPMKRPRRTTLLRLTEWGDAPHIAAGLANDVREFLDANPDLPRNRLQVTIRTESDATDNMFSNRG